MKVLVSDKIAEEGVKEFGKYDGIEVTVKTGMEPAELLETIPDYDALVVRSATKVTREVIEAGKKLKVVGRAGAGVDNIDLDAASEHNVIVMNTPGGNAEGAAELAISLMFATARNIARADATMKEGKWEKKKLAGVELAGKKLGIIGIGFVGSIVGKRMKAFGMDVSAYDPYYSADKAAELGIRLTTLDEVLADSDFITVHVPKNRETEGMIDREAFGKMKEGVYFINCSRGGIVVEADLLNALDSGKVAAAGIDVYSKEPPEDLSLVRHPRVTATPHIGASTREAQINVALMIARQIGEFLTTGKVMNAVNR